MCDTVIASFSQTAPTTIASQHSSHPCSSVIFLHTESWLACVTNTAKIKDIATSALDQLPGPAGQPHEQTTLHANLPADIKTLYDCSPGLHLDCNLLRHRKLESSSYVASEFLTHRNCEVINAYCLKSQFWSDLLYSNRSWEHGAGWY